MVKDHQENIWIKVENFIDQICSFRDISSTIRLEIFKEIYDYLMSSSSQVALSKNISTDGCRSMYCGSGLYYHIKTCIRDKLTHICQSINDLSDEEFLQLYEIHWYNYKSKSRILNFACSVLNRQWVRQQNESDIDEIGVLSQHMWEEYLFKPLFPFVTRTCLKLIKMQRYQNLSINGQSIRNILQLYTDQNFNEMIKVGHTIESIYEEYFEIPFLRDIEEFYHQQTIFSLETTSLLEYLTQLANYFNQEIDFAKSYLPQSKSTLQILINKLEEILIPDNAIMEKMKMIISNENSVFNIDVERIYELISHIPKIKNELIVFIENYIYEKGMESISKNTFEVYIETIYNFHQKYFTFIQETIKTDLALMTSLNKACVRLINNDTNKLPERLAHYCDRLLRKRTRTVETTNLEERFNQIMVVLNYLQDKSVFFNLYQKLLARRLVHQSSISNEFEELVILKLKVNHCELTFELERMCKDIIFSSELTSEYRTFCENQHFKGIVDLSAMVLNSYSWSFSVPPNLILPSELRLTFDSFTDFYTHQHNGRKLTWLHQHSKGELQTFFTLQMYTLQVSTYQMIILLLFNKRLNWTVEQIQVETQMKFELLISVLRELLKSNILICIEVNEDFDVKINHSIQLTHNFTSERSRITLLVEQKESERLDRTNDEDYQMVIQAALVRTMKAHQTLKHALLVEEVIQQLSSRFQPKISVIKKCIDILIDKEYLERDFHDKDILCYLN